MSFTIVHRLVLAVFLRDTATGKPVSDGTTAFFIHGKKTDFQPRGEGMFILLGTERENFHLEIHTKDYMPYELAVDFDCISSQLPLIHIQLVPNKKYVNQWKGFLVEGVEAGIRSVDALQLDVVPCYMQSFDPRKRLLTLSNPNHLQLDRNWYGILNENQKTYEVFEIESKRSNQQFLLTKDFSQPVESHFPIYPLVFGWVGEGGSYHMTMRDEHSHAKWLLRFTSDEKERFELLDFRLKEEENEEE